MGAMGHYGLLLWILCTTAMDDVGHCHWCYGPCATAMDAMGHCYGCCGPLLLVLWAVRPSWRGQGGRGGEVESPGQGTPFPPDRPEVVDNDVNIDSKL